MQPANYACSADIYLDAYSPTDEYSITHSDPTTVVRYPKANFHRNRTVARSILHIPPYRNTGTDKNQNALTNSNANTNG
jgi:hypothetical protein